MAYNLKRLDRFTHVSSCIVQFTIVSTLASKIGIGRQSFAEVRGNRSLRPQIVGFNLSPIQKLDDERTTAKPSACIGCDFWQGKVDLMTDAQEASRLVRTPDHEHFHIGPSASNASRGFGGRAFIVEFFDGRKVETNNLWSQGTIPAHFRERLPPNANLRSKS
jgi:hypothetical protein